MQLFFSLSNDLNQIFNQLFYYLIFKINFGANQQKLSFYYDLKIPIATDATFANDAMKQHVVYLR